MCVTTSSTVWLPSRGTSNSWKRPSAPPLHTRTRSAEGGRSGALVKARQHELAVSQRLGGGEAAVGGAEHALEQLVARLVGTHFLAQQSRDGDVDVLAHGAHRARVGAQLDHRQDRVAGPAALPRRGEVHGEGRW